MTDDLVQRLFAEADNFKVDREVGMRAMLYRAADCIEAQAAEIERLREECQAQYDRGYYDGRATLDFFDLEIREKGQ